MAWQEELSGAKKYFKFHFNDLNIKIMPRDIDLPPSTQTVDLHEEKMIEDAQGKSMISS